MKKFSCLVSLSLLYGLFLSINNVQATNFNEVFRTEIYNKYDEQGNIIETTETKWNESDNLIEQNTYDGNGELKENQHGDAIYRYKYDEQGNQIERSVYGIDNKLKENDFDGIAIEKNKYDNKGNTIESSTYGADNQLKLDQYKIAINRYKYNENNRKIEWTKYGIDNQLKLDPGGTAIYRYKYDDEGNQVEISEYGNDGQLKDGITIYRYKYDDKGNKTEEHNYDKKEKLISWGVASLYYKYDKNGNQIRSTSYDNNGKLKEDINGVAIYNSKYGDNAEILEYGFYDANYHLTEVSDGIALTRYKYDDKGQEIQRDQYDKDGKLKEDNSGIAIYRYKYNNDGSRMEESRYGKDGKLKDNINGVAVIQFKDTDISYSVNDLTASINYYPSIVISKNPAIDYKNEVDNIYVDDANEKKKEKESMIDIKKNVFINTIFYGKAINFLYDKNIIEVNNVVDFYGDEEVKRAEVAKFLLLAKGIKPNDDIKNNDQFNDVINGEWYVKYVIEANKQGIIKGYADGSFNPNQSIRRGEFLVMLAQTFNLSENIPHSYQDITPEMEWVNNSAGIAEKYNLFPYDKTDDHNLKPADFMTRNEVAMAIYQYLKLNNSWN